MIFCINYDNFRKDYQWTMVMLLLENSADVLVVGFWNDRGHWKSGTPLDMVESLILNSQEEDSKHPLEMLRSELQARVIS
jgi:hypothetical protein